MFEPVEGHEQLLAGRREPLAERGRLGGNVVRTSHHHQFGMLAGERREPRQRRDHAGAHQLERGSHLELLDVLREISRRHAFVDVLGPCECGELVDARLHVVPGDALPLLDRPEVDVVDGGFVGLDDPVGDGTPEVALRS